LVSSSRNKLSDGPECCGHRHTKQSGQPPRNLQIDPLADATFASPYNYTENNPINLIDPTGTKSTHTDSTGTVVAVYNDGDLGVYKHDDAASKEDVDKKREKDKSTSGGGEKVDETEYWDEFREHDDEGNVLDGVENRSKILFGTSWDETIETLHEEAMEMDLPTIANNSTLGRRFDVKSDLNFSPHGFGMGRLLNGKYATGRSAGNYLAGYNGRHGTYYGVGVGWHNFMKIAGAVHQNQWHGAGTAINIIGGAVSYGPAPWFGEIDYAGRRILAGWNHEQK